ncbi:hypothetical protein LUX33_37170 [Actinomadura madurae]|uniref:phosphorylase family protein n=1 Tax=Actinomadura madurae TaxID=1993 RepID=UPI0020D2219D|nr:hypothetical protein [Actinomadura madurae]MCP9953511.1 hypothetical protein [Actinomadura madurae]
MTRLVVCAALGIEARALSQDGDLNVVRIGMGRPRRGRPPGTCRSSRRSPSSGAAARWTTGCVPATCSSRPRCGARPAPCGAGRPNPSPGLLERTTGATVHRGPLVTVDHMVTGSERASLAATGALVADMESAELAAAAGERPFAVVRAIVDTPGRPLVSPATIPGGTAALRRLRTVGPALREWAGAAARAASSSPVPGRSAPGWSGRSRSWNARSPCTGRPSTCASRSSTTPMWWTT